LWERDKIRRSYPALCVCVFVSAYEGDLAA
jgi:hypothetical protein